jgi:tRNA-splicing ligase RtcB
MNVIKIDGGLPIKAWTEGVPVEDAALKQLHNLSRMPFAHSHIAVMPDVHWGMGATVGSVIATKGAIIPASVGVDIGCGMMAVKTNLTAADLPDNLHGIRAAIEAAVPHGRTDNGGPNDRGAWGDDHYGTWYASLCKLTEKHPKLQKAALRAPRHIGTLGTGNHFIELCLDESQSVWVMLHSGSRGIGNAIGSHFIQKAKQDMEKWFITHYRMRTWPTCRKAPRISMTTWRPSIGRRGTHWRTVRR